ncbi:hypothetical protein ACW5XF_05330 [Aeromonas lusitana]|nr:hypothetical protein [Aeromonas lusitana]
MKPPPGVSTVWLVLFLRFMMLALALLFDQATRTLQQLWFGGEPC